MKRVREASDMRRATSNISGKLGGVTPLDRDPVSETGKISHKKTATTSTEAVAVAN